MELRNIHMKKWGMHITYRSSNCKHNAGKEVKAMQHDTVVQWKHGQKTHDIGQR